MVFICLDAYTLHLNWEKSNSKIDVREEFLDFRPGFLYDIFDSKRSERFPRLSPKRG